MVNFWGLIILCFGLNAVPMSEGTSNTTVAGSVVSYLVRHQPQMPVANRTLTSDLRVAKRELTEPTRVYVLYEAMKVHILLLDTM